MGVQSGSVVAVSSFGRRGIVALAVPCLVLVVVIGVALAGIAGGGAGGGFQPSAVAVADIPGNYLALYLRAGARYGLDWAVLAAIGKIECDHGRLDAAGCNPPGTVNALGATGPMQFLGTTWRVTTPTGAVPAVGPATGSVSSGFATDGDGDGVADVWNPADAIAAAARYLRAAGAPRDYQRAVFAYNHDASYVSDVLARADAYRGAFAPGASGGADAVLRWAVAHVGVFSYSQGPSTDRGGDIAGMQSREPAGVTCDCSMFARWAFAQAGLDIGSTTVTQWPANGLLPDADIAAGNALVVRGVGSEPPSGGYRPADLIFFGHGSGDDGHVAIYLGDGQLVQCSASGGGSNIRSLSGYAAPTGWVRWALG